MITHRNPRVFALGTSLLLLAACGRDVTETGVKLAGVGLDPQEIGPTPTNHGGLIEYDWVDFAGAGLPLGLMGLVSYDAVGPGMATFKPPYALVYGLGFIFEEDVAGADTLFGSFAPAPGVEGSCYSNFEPQAYLSNIADAGTQVSFTASDGSTGFEIGRRPLYYPVNVESLFPYYSELAPWRKASRTYVRPVDDDASLTEFASTVYQGGNFAFNTKHVIDWPGGFAPEEASPGSIPVPLAGWFASSDGGDDARSITLPTQPVGVMLSWNGPRYDASGRQLEDAGADLANFEGESTGETFTNTTCMQFQAHSNAPTSPADCAQWVEDNAGGVSYAVPLYDFPEEPSVVQTNSNLPQDNSYLPKGQMYTAPWDTDDGQLRFDWIPGEGNADEVVTITVRLLGAVETDDQYKMNAKVAAGTPQSANQVWKDYQTLDMIPDHVSLPEGQRDALPCDDEGDVEWVFDSTLTETDPATGESRYVSSLQGEPTSKLAELTCRVPDASGTFTLSPDMLERIRDYGDQNGAAGAIFYFARTTAINLDGPPVRDRYGQRRDTSPIRVVSNAVQLGRFWFGE